VKYIAGGGGCQFVYSSIDVTNVTVTGNPKPLSAQTMSIHRSTDCGHTWAGPFEVKPATFPTSTTDAADKEFISVDPDTARLGLSWSNFVQNGAAGVEIRFSYSDNAMTANPPTWSNSTVLNPSSVRSAFDTGRNRDLPDLARTVFISPGPTRKLFIPQKSKSLFPTITAEPSKPQSHWIRALYCCRRSS